MKRLETDGPNNMCKTICLLFFELDHKLPIVTVAEPTVIWIESHQRLHTLPTRDLNVTPIAEKCSSSKWNLNKHFLYYLTACVAPCDKLLPCTALFPHLVQWGFSPLKTLVFLRESVFWNLCYIKDSAQYWFVFKNWV